MSSRNARLKPPRSRVGDNHELTLIRSCRIHWRRVDSSRVLAPATGEALKLVAKIFTTECSGSSVDNGFAHLRLQSVGVHHGGVLVSDQLAGIMEIAECQTKSEICC